ncbi:MAG: exodeoxyribonuclease VII small subunit [Candidatus Omnitrophica bacterium]|nr:exodeoxyribonuclease VII small subunit [Candidatus Omnitrophota bacterium]
MADIKYNKAIKKLDDIIQKIENEEIDVDELAGKVKEAINIIQTCKNKIDKAEMEVKKMVKSFENEAAEPAV